MEEYEKDIEKQKSNMVWLVIVAFVLINAIIIFGSMFTGMVSDRVVSIIEIIFWFDLFAAGIVGSYFGTNIITYFREKNILIKQLRSQNAKSNTNK